MKPKAKTPKGDGKKKSKGKKNERPIKNLKVKDKHGKLKLVGQLFKSDGPQKRFLSGRIEMSKLMQYPEAIDKDDRLGIFLFDIDTRFQKQGA